MTLDRFENENTRAQAASSGKVGLPSFIRMAIQNATLSACIIQVFQNGVTKSGRPFDDGFPFSGFNIQKTPQKGNTILAGSFAPTGNLFFRAKDIDQFEIRILRERAALTDCDIWLNEPNRAMRSWSYPVMRWLSFINAGLISNP